MDMRFTSKRHGHRTSGNCGRARGVTRSASGSAVFHSQVSKGAGRPGVRVGASSPAKPYATVPRRQHFISAPAGRPPELAPRSRQSLEPPFRGANFMPRSPPVGRPSWRLAPGKALSYRSEAPTFCPRASRWTARVGASLPRQSSIHRSEAPTLCPGARRWGARVGASPRQSLMPPFRGANILPRSQPAERPSWRLTPGKALSHRSEAPTFWPGARRPSARVGASPPAKP